MPQLLGQRQTMKIGQPWLLQTSFEIQIGDRWQVNPSKKVEKNQGLNNWWNKNMGK